jgi:predicted transcriptional regulator
MVLEKKKESMITAFQHEIDKEAFIVKRSWGAEKQRFFLSRERQRIFQKICEAPCSTISRIGRDLSLSPSGIRWHMEKLSKGGFVNKRSINNRWIFYPADMLTDEDIQVLSVIQGSVAGNLLRQMIKTPVSARRR